MSQITLHSKYTPSEIAQKFNAAEVSTLEMSVNDFIKNLHQSRSVIASIMDIDREDLGDWAMNNILWLISDKLEELEKSLIHPDENFKAAIE